MKFLLPIAAMICTAISTLTTVVFCLAMSANSTPAQFRTIKLWMAGISLLGLAGIVAGIFLMRVGRHGMAAGVAFLPTMLILLIFIIAMITQ